MAFRAYTPTRSSITKLVKDYGIHRDNLRKDYQNRCGYCDDIDTWRFTWFEIDHLVPQKYLVTISSTDYSNLVYACRSCNNAKRAQWPTKDEKIHNLNDEGFIDPCHTDYNDQFSRATDGRIVAKTKLGDWIYNALKFYKPQHEIIWNIEQLDNMISQTTPLYTQITDVKLLHRLIAVHEGFRGYLKQLSEAGFQKAK
jgi:uncharacterized protein (TIGR02646 family)